MYLNEFSSGKLTLLDTVVDYVMDNQVGMLPTTNLDVS